ncbi:MAG: 50S ribosomal protein L9 [Acidobacteriota bacterium]|nr:50S ribosomal protein L9 [Acidobacteriota bacterium]
MANTKILLREDVDNLGGRGEIVKVKSGYARNFLLPQRLATLATKGNLKQIEQERSALLTKAATEKSTAEAQAEQMRDIALTFERKAGETGTLFGSVTTMDIAEALKAKGYDFDRRKIVLKDAIKETGDYTASVKLHREVVLEVPVSVTAEGAVAEVKTEKTVQPEAKTETAEAATTEKADDPSIDTEAANDEETEN